MATLFLLTALLQDGPMDEEGIAFFEKHIRPILSARCLSCHGAEAREPGGSLRLDTRMGILTGGGRGPALVPRRPEESLILRALRGVDEKLVMPKEGKRLTAEEISRFEAWIKMGAPDPRGAAAFKRAAIDVEAARRNWPFAPVADPPPATVKNAAWARTGLDRFILAALEKRGLAPAPDADQLALIRRATFDLIGLPPTPEEIDAFLADDAPDAFARVVDRLLASPHYGERWGRHWLDVVRYADTAGDNSDYPVPQHFLYRNYVIRAFNDDVPYDRFIREQIAGDLLEPRALVATGYLANARRFGSRVEDYAWHLTYEDTIDNLGRAFLGLTINCARCHDHKFDPIRTEDYYALYGIFQSTRYAWPGIELDKVQRDFVPLVSADEVAAAQEAIKARRNEMETALRELEMEGKTAEAKAAKNALEIEKRKRAPYPTAYAVSEGPAIGNARVQVKGQPHNPGAEVPRRFLEVLGGAALSPEASGSGRRELADWLADPTNPLTARVMINRIWLHHFGRGIVASPNNFGKQGQLPSHPELLDWLASRFVEGGWSIKSMHRLILLSRTWQTAALEIPANRRADPGNALFWRRDRRRLEAEAIRDTLMAVAGTLDLSPAVEPHPFPPQENWDFTQHKPFKDVYDTRRRSIYLMTQRIVAHPYLALFDGADGGASTEKRTASTTPLQSLFFMNSPFVHEQARSLAARLLREGADDAARLDRAMKLAFGRPPTADERAAALSHLTRVRAQEPGDAPAWESFVRVLFMSNELIHVQ